MNDSERKSKACGISKIWIDIDFDGQPAKMSIVNGQAKIRVDGDGFDVTVKGVFEPDDIEGVITAHKKEIADNEVNYRALQDRCLEDQCQDDDYGLIGISEEELEAEIRKFEAQCKVISMKTRKSI